MLKDGADSVGILGALNRVYLNIGLFSEEWLQHFKPLIGGKPITPIEIAVARKNSAMWNANETQTQDVALFFAVSAEPDYLADAPGGEAYLTEDAKILDARQGGLRRPLRALPLEQDPRGPRRRRRARLGRVLGVDQDRGLHARR